MLVPLYFAISFLSAFLLFSVQPMAAKAVLPVLGGAPFVWNGCMLFFQTLLLGGYLYAHKLVKRLSPKGQVALHMGLLVVAVALFPAVFKGTSLANPADAPLGWLMGTLLLSIGLPYFALSATAPLVQGWFALSGHKRAANPYFLYAASNLGSFGSLFCYLALVEPNFRQAEQLALLRWAFVVLVGLFGFAGLALFKRHAAPVPQQAAGQVSWRQVGYWLLWSVVPSSLLYGVTQYITTDVASMPLLWVLPLALYLLTFVLVFAEKPRGVAAAQRLHIPLVTAVLMLYVWDSSYSFEVMFLHLVVFFVVVLSCHGSLSAAKPAPAQLTNFYLWISLGGVLGGLFNTFVAPLLFVNITEYPLMLAVSMLACMSWPTLRAGLKLPDNYVAAAVAVVLSALFAQLLKYSDPIADLLETSASVVTDGLWLYVGHLWRAAIVVMLCFGAYRYRPMNLLFCVVLLVGGMGMRGAYKVPDNVLFEARNIFGVNRVTELDGKRIFSHGTTMHGMQSLDGEFRLKPITYYAPVKMMFEAIEKDAKVKDKPIAVMGLGAGTLVCYGKAGQMVDVFEIDPLVLRIAADPKLFTYLSDCPAEKSVEIGDARIGVAGKEDGRYSAILMDAFTSDAVPAHLLTKEALALYMSKLAEGGFVGIHISNRHLGLEPVITAAARQLGVPSYVLLYQPLEFEQLVSASHWVFLSHRPDLMDELKRSYPGWSTAQEEDASYVWHDDFSNMLKVISFKEVLRGLLN